MAKDKDTLTPDREEPVDAASAEGRSAIRKGAPAVIVRSDADLSWAKPYVDDGLASIARGEGIPAEQVDAEMKDYFAKRR